MQNLRTLEVRIGHVRKPFLVEIHLHILAIAEYSKLCRLSAVPQAVGFVVRQPNFAPPAAQHRHTVASPADDRSLRVIHAADTPAKMKTGTVERRSVDDVDLDCEALRQNFRQRYRELACAGRAQHATSTEFSDFHVPFHELESFRKVSDLVIGEIGEVDDSRAGNE